MRRPALLLPTRTYEVSEGAKPSTPSRGDGLLLHVEKAASSLKENPNMTLADEPPEGPGGFSAPADEVPTHELLALIEEQGAAGGLHGSEVYELYRRADELLEKTEEAETLARLRAC